MPLPESWRGVFWDRQSKGHLLVDPPPENFIAFLADYPDDPVFLVAGGCLDLKRNGFTERANAIMAAAKDRWPEFIWDMVEILVDVTLTVLPPIEEGELPPDISAHVYDGFQGIARIARRCP